MAKKSSIEKNKHRQLLAVKNESRRKRLKKTLMDRTLNVEERFNASIKLAELPRNSAPVRYRNRCFETGRARGFYRKVGLSRIRFRELASEGKLPGMIQSSW
ncbi:MAG: 30S ribosomal protein S14 [Alphaproteobacteria bacterium]